MQPKAEQPVALPGIPLIQKETYDSGPYFWDNFIRLTTRDVILQQTLAGSVKFFEGGREHLATEGMALLFRHGEATSYGLDESCQLPYELRWALLTDVPAVTSLYEEIVGRFGPVVRMEKGREASRLLARLAAEREGGSIPDRFLEAENVFRLLLAVYREQLTPDRGDVVAIGRHLLQNEFRSPRNIKEWAAELGISREHFTREFRHRYGESPADFLRRLRLNHAKMLLENPTVRQRDVAAASGFGSETTFRHAWKRNYGCSPRNTQ